jgi:hypothetical protein
LGPFRFFIKIRGDIRGFATAANPTAPQKKCEKPSYLKFFFSSFIAVVVEDGD